jgi:hypothetical protein
MAGGADSRSGTYQALRRYTDELGGFGEWPEQRRTGSRGYLGKLGSDCDSWQSRNCEPLAEEITRACTQFAQSPKAS